MEVPWRFRGGSVEVPWRFRGGSVEHTEPKIKENDKYHWIFDLKGNIVSTLGDSQTFHIMKVNIPAPESWAKHLIAKHMINQ